VTEREAAGRPGDPCAADDVEHQHRPVRETSWRMFGGTGSLAELDALERRFRGLRDEVLAGRRGWADPEWLAVAGALRVDGPVRHDRRPPRVAPCEVPDAALADAAEDLLPDLGVCVERVDGPDAVPDAVNAAVLACVEMSERRTPLDAWGEEEPDRALVVAARVVQVSVPGVFLDGVSLLPRPPRLVPTGPAPAGCVVARPYRVEPSPGAADVTPWRWSMVRRLPRVPDARVLLRRMVLALWEVRLLDRRHTFEDGLRVHADVLYRTCAELVRG
jgi:hypothetical protein